MVESLWREIKIKYRRIISGGRDGEPLLKVEHPLTVCLIRDEEKRPYVHGNGTLAGFSKPELARQFIKVKNLGSNVNIHTQGWDSLLKEFEGHIDMVLMDHSGVNAFYSTLPLKK